MCTYIHIVGVFRGQFIEEAWKYISVSSGYWRIWSITELWNPNHVGLVIKFLYWGQTSETQGHLCLSLTDTLIIPSGVLRKCSGSIFIIDDSLRNSFLSRLSPSFNSCWCWVFYESPKAISPSLLMYLATFNGGFSVATHGSSTS